MGWLGWSPRETMATDVNVIEIALEGRMDFITYAFHGKNPFPPKKLPMSTDRWRDFAKRHNMTIQGKK